MAFVSITNLVPAILRGLGRLMQAGNIVPKLADTIQMVAEVEHLQAEYRCFTIAFAAPAGAATITAWSVPKNEEWEILGVGISTTNAINTRLGWQPPKQNLWYDEILTATTSTERKVALSHQPKLPPLTDIFVDCSDTSGAAYLYLSYIRREKYSY